jgi:transposase
MFDMRWPCGVLVVGPGHQVAVSQAVEQVVDGLAAHRHPEFTLEDPADIGGPEGAGAIIGPGRGVEPLHEPGIVLRGQRAWPSGPGLLAERLEAAAVVLGDPVLDRAERASQAPGGKRCGPSLLGEDDRLDPLPGAFLGDGIGADHPGQEVRVYFQDEARFGTQGTITRVWARRGSRPRAVRQNGRQWLYVLMAVCAATGTASALIMPELNTAVVNLFLEQFSHGLPTGVHAVLIWDGAGFHTGKDLVVPGNVSLIQLPPYSPELNPVENLWHYLRSHHWSNREYEGYTGLQEEAVRSVRAVCQDAEKLKTICNADYVNRRA